MMASDGKILTPPPLPIAIVGMACRLPGDATNPSKLWKLCADGRDGYSPIPKDRFDVRSLYDANNEAIGKNHVLGGYFLHEDIARFDAAFFNLPADVASATDPQIRLLLENVYEATEDAGIPIEKLAGSNTSVFSGCYGKDYHNIQVRDPESMSSSFITSNSTTMLANRISHFFDLQGASMAIDTGCSSGLVALHQGCQSIRSGESEISIVGASSLILSQDLFISLSSLGMVGPEGKCYAWDSRAEGYGRGEGVAVLILKPFDVAISDGDRIHAVIRDTALNQDGKTATITSPSTEAQIKLIKSCYKRAGLDISETGYVEAHMTGTQVGDVAEAEALAKTFGESRKNDPILIGSVKTNIGHTEPVSGLAAIIKTVYALKHRQLPPNMNYEKKNPKINLKGWNLQVPTSLTQWPQGKAFRASINNFGYGGANAHVILESAPPIYSHFNTFRGLRSQNETNGHSLPQNGVGESETNRIYVLSARDPSACLIMAKNLAAHLRQLKLEGFDPSPADLAYTLLERRSRLPWTVAIRARNLEELTECLEQPALKPIHVTTQQPRIGFVFNGQGAQWYAMGRELITAYPVFGTSIKKAGEILKHYGASWSLYEELMRDKQSTRVAEIDLSQPVSVALQLCLVDLLKTWGITPSAVTSHSSGEIAAAYAVDALCFEEALGVAYFRGELALKHHKLSPLAGGMVAASISPNEAEQYIHTTDGCIVVACINSGESVTLSGDLPALDEVASHLERDGYFARKLKVPLAYHSHHMLPMSQDYVDKLRSLLPERLQWNDNIRFASPVTGSIISSDVLTPEHWARNLTNPVLFSQAFDSMCRSDANIDFVVEIGAHSTLAGPIRQILKDRKMTYASCLKRSSDAVETMQELVCELVTRGYPVDLKGVNSPLCRETDRFLPNLPTYPWNHTTRYWAESRVNKEIRYKKFPPHELLGLPISGGTGPIPTWRKFLRLSDLPWLVDHQVDGNAVLPGAAYITMAIEATRLLTDPLSVVKGYRLREVNIINALNIPDSTDGIEVHTCLRICREGELDHSGWYEFEVGSFDAGGSWIKNCSGFVSAEMKNINKSPLFREIETPHEDSFFNFGAQVQSIDIASLYATMRQMNIYHGPAFQNLIDGRKSNNKTITNLSIPSVASETFDYVIHPTTLDTIIQATFGGLPEEIIQGNMVLPRSIGTMFVPSDLKRQAGSNLKAFTESRKPGRRGVASNVVVANVSADEISTLCLRMNDFYCQAVPLDTQALNNGTGGREVPGCSTSRWELDILHEMPAVIKESMKLILSNDEIDFEKKLFRTAYHFIYDAVVELKSDDKQNWAWYHKLFYAWMEHIVALGTSGALCPGSKSWSMTSKGRKQMLIDDIKDKDASSRLTVQIGEQLARIVRGDVAPLELMKEGNSLNQYYMEIPALKSRSYKHVKHILELYAVKNPGAKVLEIGGGTGGATQTVLEAFGSRGPGSLIGSYTFTDVSVDFFEGVKQKLAAWEGMMNFVKLDIELDPVEQSFAAGGYDLIVASMVIHATKSLQKSMSHIRKLLKPGGKLLLIEATQNRLDTQLIFGTLPEWWLSEEPFRKESPNVSLSIWEDTLKATGFNGIDCEIGDCEQGEIQSSSVILSTATRRPSYPGSISIVYTTQPSQVWIEQLTESIKDKTCISPNFESLDQVTLVQDKICIFTAEMTGSFIDEMNSKSFEKLKNLLVQSRGVLWLSCGSIVDAQIPTFAQAQGLLRTLRLEHSSNRYVQLDFERRVDPWSGDNIRHIVHVLQQSFNYDTERCDTEWEYAVKNSMLHVPRVYTEKNGDTTNVDLVPQRERFNQPGRTVVWKPSSLGLLSNPCFVDDAKTSGDVPNGMVEIEAKAFGLNFRDVMIALGQLDDTLVGHDCAGIITRLGKDTEGSGLKIGDRVCGLAQGRFANVSWAYWTGVSKLPDDMAWEDGAAIPVAYITAYYSLVHVARLQKNESVLIHAAAGGAGQAAIVVAQHVGAEVFATCSTEAKRDLLIKKYHIDPTHIFSSRDISFASAIMKVTEGKGVDVVLNSLSGPLLKATWSCIARFGRFIEIGKVDIEAARSLDTTPFGRCATYVGVDILQLNEYNGLMTHQALTESVRICHKVTQANGGHPMYPIQQYSISDMENAMRQMQSGLHVGKIVLVPGHGDEVDVISRPRSLSLADPDATYLIVGGLGGIGQAIALWMVDKGAENILLVSRKAESHPDAEDLVRRAKINGCNLVIQNCDVSSQSSLAELIAYCSSVSLPKIKGVINSAMVLDDTVFERMTFEQWQRAINAKVSSSINLHEMLSNLSFFVMLSSLAGVIGNISQASYAAGNTFQDALARHRAVSGLPGVSLNLSAVTSVGYVANADANSDSRVQARVEALGTVSLNTDDILRRLEEAVLLNPLRTQQENAQVIVGLSPWERLPDGAPVQQDRRFGTLRLARDGGVGVTGPGAEAEATNPTGLLVRALETAVERPKLVAEAMAERIAVIFNVTAEEMDLSAPVASHGIDSLVAVELRNWLSGAAKAKVSIFDILQSSSLVEFATLVIERSQLIK